MTTSIGPEATEFAPRPGDSVTVPDSLKEQRRQGPIGRRGQVALSAAVVASLLGASLLFGIVPPGKAGSDEPLRVEPPAPVTAMDQGFGPANNSPLLAADPTHPRFVALANRLDAPDFSCALHVSGDGGDSWTPVQPVPELPSGVEKCYAPEIAFDGNGTLYYLFVGLAGTGNEPVGAFLTTSSDQALTFSTPRQVLGPRNFGVRMAIDPTVGELGRLHLVWLAASSDPPLGGFGPPPNPIMAAYSDDGGVTFSEPTQVSDPGRERVVAPALALAPGDAVHVGYYDLGNDLRDYHGLEGPVWEGTWSMIVSSSSDAGASFGQGAVVDDSIVPHERVMLIFTMPPPALAADGERLCAAWTDASLGDPDAVLRCSIDRGRTWGERRRINDDGIGTGSSQYMPRLSMSGGGRLDTIFFDRRNDPQNINYDIFYSYSPDGGQHFAPNVRLTPRSSSSRIGQQYVGAAAEGKYEFGARLGLLSFSNTVVAAWTDTSNSRADSTGQDVFTAEISVPSSRVQPIWARLFGAALLLVGALGIVRMAVLWRTRPKPAALGP